MKRVWNIGLTTRWPLFAAAAVAFFTSGCDQAQEILPHDPVFHCDEYDIWPDSVDLHSGIVVRAVGDSVLQISADGIILRQIKTGEAEGKAMKVNTGISVFDALYNLEAGRSREKRQYTSLLPYELYLNPLEAKEGMELLESRVKNNYVVPIDTRLYSWPVVNDNPQWLLAAGELYKVTGNQQWLEKLGKVAQNVTAEDFRVGYNRSTGLIGGVPRHATAGGESAFPKWMEPVDLFNCASLSVNVTYWSALRQLEAITAEMARRNGKSHLPELPFDSDRLRHDILLHFWMPNVGMLSGLNYGYPFWPVALKSTDNLGQALAVVSGLLSPAMASAAVGNTPVKFSGMELFTPGWSGAVTTGNVADLIRSMWVVAASRSGNDAAYNAAVGAILFNAASEAIGDASDRNSDSSPIETLVLRGLLGIRFASDGISFAPSVPSGLPGNKTVKGLRYRKSIIDITVEGIGNTIASFSIDGKNSEPFYAASLEGRHTVTIVLGENQSSYGAISGATAGMLPPAPDVEWVTERDATVTSREIHHETAGQRSLADESKKYFVYLNGVITDEFLTRHFRLYEAPATTSVQIVEVRGDRWMSFSARPHLYVPEGCQTVIYLPEWASSGSRIISDRVLAQKFVETNRWKNRTLRMEFEVDEDGDYAIDVHYLYGLGIVNSRRRTAMRGAYIDGERVGVLVFPQLCSPPRDRETGEGWQSMTSFTNPVKTSLTAGRHTLELKIYQPSPVYVDPYNNDVLADFVRIVRLP